MAGEADPTQNVKPRRSPAAVPTALTVTRYVWPGTRTFVSSSASNNGSNFVGLIKSIVPRVTRYRRPSSRTSRALDLRAAEPVRSIVRAAEEQVGIGIQPGKVVVDPERRGHHDFDIELQRHRSRGCAGARLGATVPARRATNSSRSDSSMRRL